MARRSNQKLKLMYLSKIFSEKTDEQHGLTLNELRSELARYGIQCERKCLYDDIEALRVFGMDIVTQRDRYVRYYVASGRLDAAAFKLLGDFLKCCEYIPEAKLRELLLKLGELGYGAQNALLVSDATVLKKNGIQAEQTYKNIDIICRAIIQDRKISFKRFEWNSHKQRILINSGEYFSLSPLKLTFKNRKYVIIAYDDKTGELVELLPERLINISVSNQKRQGIELEDAENLSLAKVENIRLRCRNCLAGEVFAKFGLDVSVLSNRDDFFEISAKTTIDDELYSWLFINGSNAKIISPEWVVKEYEKLLRQNNNL